MVKKKKKNTFLSTKILHQNGVEVFMSGHYNYELADFSWAQGTFGHVRVNLPEVITQEIGLCSSLSMFFLKHWSDSLKEPFVK